MLRITDRARRWTAIGLLTAVAATGCGGGDGGGAVASGDGSTPSTTAAPPTTAAAEPLDSDTLSDLLLSVDDIGGRWSREGQVAIGGDQVAVQTERDGLSMTCDGEPMELPSQANAFEGMAAVAFSDRGRYPVMVQEIDSDEPEKLSAALDAYVSLYGGCDEVALDFDGYPATATFTQFAFPDVGADEAYGFDVAITVEGATAYSVQILLRKGSVLSVIQISDYVEPNQTTMATVASVAVDKIATHLSNAEP